MNNNIHYNIKEVGSFSLRSSISSTEEAMLDQSVTDSLQHCEEKIWSDIYKWEKIETKESLLAAEKMRYYLSKKKKEIWIEYLLTEHPQNLSKKEILTNNSIIDTLWDLFNVERNLRFLDKALAYRLSNPKLKKRAITNHFTIPLQKLKSFHFLQK